MQVLVVVGGNTALGLSDATYTFKTGDSAWIASTSSNGLNPRSPLGVFYHNNAITMGNAIYLVGGK